MHFFLPKSIVTGLSHKIYSIVQNHMNAELNECAKSVDEYDRVLQANAPQNVFTKKMCIFLDQLHLTNFS